MRSLLLTAIALVMLAYTPKTCVQQGLVCGAASDGCGGSLQCGTCPGGTSCSAGQCVKGVKK